MTATGDGTGHTRVLGIDVGSVQVDVGGSAEGDLEAMERQEIRVVTLSDLARAAATAQRELGL